MGGSQSGLKAAVQRAQAVLGHSAVAGRYHIEPNRLEDDYDVTHQELGTGYSGAVHLAEHKISGEKFAVKEYALYTLDSDRMEELQLEAEIYLALDHPHVARLVDVYQSRTHLYIVMEACTGGELFYRVEKLKRFSEGDAAEAFHQMVLAVNYLHAHDIAHRDLKLENFLYESDDNDHLKLIDFGFSDFWDHSTTLAAAKGTLAYMAPEVIQRSYTTQCDIWSLGVILFILLSGYMPFGGNETKQRQDIKKGYYKWSEPRWAHVSAEAKDLVKSILRVNPDLRPTAEQLLSNRWVTTKKASAVEYIDPSVVLALQAMANNSRFRRTCLAMMAWSLSQQERAKVRDYFKIMDKNGDGSISLNEFRQALIQSRTSLDDAAIEQAFQVIDTSGDKEINYTEFLAAMVESRFAIHDNLVYSAFNRFDADNSGEITFANLKSVLGSGFSDRDIKTIILNADADRDGKISYDEFCAYMRKSMDVSSQVIDNVHHRERMNKRLVTKANAKTRSISVRVEDDEAYDYDSSEEDEEDGLLSRLSCALCR